MKWRFYYPAKLLSLLIRILQTNIRSELTVANRLLVTRLSDIEKYGIEGNMPTGSSKNLKFLLSKVTVISNRGCRMNRADQDGFTLFWYFWCLLEQEKVSRTSHWTKKGFHLQICQIFSKGTYLFSIHPQGIQSWGGAWFESISKFIHSPSEVDWLFLLMKILGDLIAQPIPGSWKSSRESPVPLWTRKQMVTDWLFGIWLLVNLPEPLPYLIWRSKEMPWPLVKWSHDDKYCARQGPHSAIYDS